MSLSAVMLTWWVTTTSAERPRHATELAAEAGVTAQTASAHLAKLEQAGLVVSRKQGRTRLYDLTPGGLAPVEDWMTEQRRIWGGLLDRFDDYVATVMKDRADDA